MNNTYHFFLICFCFATLSAAGQNTVKLDSLQNLLKNANQKDSIELLQDLGLFYFTAEDYSKSLDSYFNCLKLAEGIDDVGASADALNSIGRVYYNIENFELGLEYFTRALDYFEMTNDEKSIGGVFNNIALIYYELDSIDEAVEYYNKALEIKKRSNEQLNVAAIYHNLGLVFINQGDYENAIESLDSSRMIFHELGHARHAANTTNNIGRAYYKSGKYQEALVYFKDGLEEAKKVNSSFLIMDNFKYQSDCYARMGNYAEAYRFSNEYYILKDSLLSVDAEKELAEIEAKYENEIEEQENKILKKENEAKAATIKLQYFVGVGIVLIMLLSGVLAVIYYRGNLNKEKANDLLRLQKLEIEDKNEALSKLNREITKQNKEIIEQKRELEELNSIKDKLFSIISHEFRSPLNSLKGTMALLKVGAFSEQELNLISKDLTDKINSTSIFLDNLLNWAKSQMHGIHAKPLEIELSEIANDNIQLLKSMADKKHIIIDNKIGVASKAFADPNMMNLVFKNLISNAIKFSMKGGIVEIKNEPNRVQTKISISDNGIGMSAENVKMLFKVQTFTTRGTANERGTGLGLYITKNFVEANGGDIWVESKEDGGTTFNFTLPINPD